MSASLCSYLIATFAESSNPPKFFGVGNWTRIQELELRELPIIGVPGESCKTNLFFGFFFDGTKNNYVQAKKGLNHSNVARLYDCYPGLSVPGELRSSVDWQYKPSNFTHFFKTYIPGVASPKFELTRGAAMGNRGEARIIWELIQAINSVHRYFYTTPIVSTSDMMKFMRFELLRFRRVFGACILSAPLLAACGKSALPVSIHGINYSVDPFSFELKDPSNPKNKGEGELVDSYAAGGTTCCYELPKKWQPGIKVSIQSKHWVGKAADNSLHEIAGTHLVEVPRYADGKPGELWVLRAADGSMDIVSSDFQPDHPKWPGKVKGWPVPSLAYQRERWDLYIDHEKGGVRLYERMLAELNTTPDKRATDDWNFALQDDKKSLDGYSGPTDVKFRAMLRREFEQGLKRSRQQLERLERGRP
jgi:hypothetical protein